MAIAADAAARLVEDHQDRCRVDPLECGWIMVSRLVPDRHELI